MLKKYSLFFLFLFCTLNVHASIWDTIGGCISDPCNCGQSEITETWNSKGKKPEKRKFKPGTLCPPWNKGDGRDSDSCLLQFNYPGTFIAFLLNRCAEESPDSSYFTPKIRVRIQSCNAAACWSQSSTLNWDGDCVLWPTGYGLPLTRLCARVAVPAIPAPPGIDASPSPADPGYTSGVHLNSVGYTESDDTIIGVDGQVLTIEPPKLCVYSDPGLVNLVSDSGVNTDAMDWNPNKQVLHQTTKLSPVAQVLEFIVRMLGGANLPSLLGKLLGMISQDSEIIKVLQAIFNAIGEIFNIFPTLIIEVIKVFGGLNSAVDSASFGCVKLPLGPYPPPFCSSLNELSVPAVVNNICSLKKADGTFNQSSKVLPCVVSNVRNNIVNNTVRVSFNNMVPLCTGENPKPDTCVIPNNKDLFSSAKAIHAATAYTDFIKPCSEAASNAPCFTTNLETSCSVPNNGCKQGFRVVYSQVMGGVETPSDYFISDIPDCNTGTGNDSASCQKVWGVNIGEFIDVSVQFPREQKQDIDSLLTIKHPFTLTDNNGKVRSLYASISNITVDTQTPENICVFESSSLAGCIPRVKDSYSLLTYECDSRYAGIICTKNTYYEPQFIASMQVRDDSGKIIDETSTLVVPLSYANGSDPNSNPHSTATENVVTLAGYDYSSSIAFIPKDPPKDPKNDQYISMPFSGSNALNQLTIHGIYKDNQVPYDDKGNTNSNAVYLKYLEYINGKYIQGGTHACLMPKNFQHCNPTPTIPCDNNIPSAQCADNPDNTKQMQNCVLAGLINAKTVNCSVFKDKLNGYPNLSLCTSTSGCTQKETIPGKGGGVTIYSCNTGYCYTNNDSLSDPTPVCILSKNYQDRVDPKPAEGPKLDATKYFSVVYDSKGKPNYSAEESEVRDKTWQELGLCSSITVPTCAAINNPSKEHGNAIWPEADIGELVKGTCPMNWVVIDPSKPLQRYCLSNFDSKTVAFEPLGQNVGCRESKGLPIKIVSNDFPTQIVDTPYDPGTKTGDFVLNVVPLQPDTSLGVNAFPRNPNTFIDATNKPDHSALYTITFKVTLDAIMDDIDYFKIFDLWYDDCTLVYVNDQKLLSAPVASANSLDSKDQCNYGRDQGMALQANNLPIDIKPYLKQGDNIIKFQLRVIYGGGLYFKMQYKMKR